MLNSWIKTNKIVNDEWPVSRLIVLLDKICEDGVVTPEERVELLHFLSGVAASIDPQDCVANNIFTPNVNIVFPGNTFVFTGNLEYGTRKKAENEVIKREGLVAPQFRFDVNYLVVGKLGQNAWKYGKYGRKIEACMNALEKERANTKIVREKDFVKAVVECPIEDIKANSRQEPFMCYPLCDFHDSALSELRKLGWHIVLDENILTLHKKIKRKRQIEDGVLSLVYREPLRISIAISDEDNTEDLDIWGGQRPWAVMLGGKTKKTYGKVEKAAEYFMEQARLLSPIKP